MTDFVEIVDVGPRDGLQSQSALLDIDTKLEFIDCLIDAGVRRIEAASFVNPKRVPQMADVDELVSRLQKRKGVQYIGLVLNRRGFDRAMRSGIDQINCTTVASETFCQRNQGSSVGAMFGTIAEIVREAQAAKQFVGVTIAASFGCPFEGEISPHRVAKMARQFADLGVDEIALADTIGVAVPTDVSRLLDLVLPEVEKIPLRVHFHNTRSNGVANAYAAIQAGIRIVDASCGGVGGCPFAPGATGNVATEDILYMLDRMGVETGISIEKVIETAKWLEGPLGAPVPAMVSRAGLFPPGAAA
ncbi:MAG TPA: hydroxymethylglutaryl-CoA lyase [Gammaproteobacteria bacterium]|nr:hydroxymethylglutaryl-CoA lyase [Gammaproteobacteria bacterium]|tara:strand:+ start:4226 stop:5134 length:909 start_codon:yes stop_codon:yes gene_type:complete